MTRVCSCNRVSSRESRLFCQLPLANVHIPGSGSRPSLQLPNWTMRHEAPAWAHCSCSATHVQFRRTSLSVPAVRYSSKQATDPRQRRIKQAHLAVCDHARWQRRRRILTYGVAAANASWRARSTQDAASSRGV